MRQIKLKKKTWKQRLRERTYRKALLYCYLFTLLLKMAPIPIDDIITLI